MPNVGKPKSLRIRTYQMGFGDCFLLTFRYPRSQERHVLIDFGTSGTPQGNDKELLFAAAQNIGETTKGKVHAVVLTHRHRDHIRGFSTETKDGDAGSVIRSLQPDLIVQPWTEDPKAKTDATAATGAGPKGFSAEAHYLASLDTMQNVARNLVASRDAFLLTPEHPFLQFIGEDNLLNLSAVKNLQAMGKTAKHGSEYLNYGAPTKLASTLLPGVNVRVLGPPDIQQHKQVKTETKKSDEFWMMHRQFWLDQEHTSGECPGLPGAGGTRVAADAANVPLWARWFVRRTRSVNAAEALSLVRILDTAMNNTSVILLFTIGKKAFLFPGDAQIENWEYALKFAPDRQQNLEAFRDLTVYKVGHHGSRNATPKSLYSEMVKRRTAGAAKLVSLMSTMAGKHGKEESNSEVPRTTLVKALQKAGTLQSTEDLRPGQAFFDDEYEF